MAVYKIPQDVEADDKFLGPLSFKQFIFAGIAVVAGYLCFLSLTKGFWPALIVLVPFVVVGGFLGFPWGRDQPTEVWLAARIRFALKPRVRIWNQSDVNELVTITVPKKVEHHYTDGLSKNEVNSRLTGLATLLDSRGWAVKNATASVYDSPLTSGGGDDRLLSVSAAPQEVTDTIYGADVLDETSNSTALHFEELIKNSEQKHRQDALNVLEAARQQQTPQPQAQQPAQADFWYLQQQGQQPQQAPQQQMQQPVQQAAPQQNSDFWFLSGAGAQTQQQSPQPTQQQAPPQPAYSTFQAPAIVAPTGTQFAAPPVQQPIPQPVVQISAEEEQALLQKIHKEHEQGIPQYGHMKTIRPLSEQPSVAAQTGYGQPLQAPLQTQAPTPPLQQPQTAVTAPVNPAIINLANNDDLSVATLAHEANKKQQQNLSDGEVVISLH